MAHHEQSTYDVPHLEVFTFRATSVALPLRLLDSAVQTAGSQGSF